MKNLLSARFPAWVFAVWTLGLFSAGLLVYDRSETNPSSATGLRDPGPASESEVHPDDFDCPEVPVPDCEQGVSAPVAGTPGEPGPPPSSPQELLAATARIEQEGGLLLPERIHLVEGLPFSIYFSNIVGVPDPEVFVYTASCTCDFLGQERRRLRLAPRAGSAGRYLLSLRAAAPDGAPVVEKEVEIVVVPEDSGTGTVMQALMVGDSLGHQSRFPNALADLLSRSGNPRVEFVGTHRPAGAEIDHEHYGGWRFDSFFTYVGKDAAVYYRERSPFLFPRAGEEPEFNVARYLREDLKGARPKFVHVQLGINDAFLLDPENPRIQDGLTRILDDADTLLAGIRSALPAAAISVGTVIPGNAADRAYVESYGAAPERLHSAWRWRQVQMKLARAMLDHFASREDEVLVVPTHLAIDALDGYSAHPFVPNGVDYELSNAVHPSPIGDRQVAGAIYARWKAHLAKSSSLQ